MVFHLFLAAVLAGQIHPRVIAVLDGDEFARMGIVAELVERPAGISDAAFAQQLIDGEGLQPWNGQQLNSAPSEGRMGTKSVFSADGRVIIVKYVTGDMQRPGRVCRLRLARAGMSRALWNAHRWCGSVFGLTLPQAPPPPIVTSPR